MRSVLIALLLFAPCFTQSQQNSSFFSERLLIRHRFEDYYKYYLSSHLKNIRNVFIFHHTEQKFISFLNEGWDRKRDHSSINGKQLKVLVRPKMPYVYKNSKKLGTWQGLFVDFWSYAEDMYNFTSTYSRNYSEYDVSLSAVKPDDITVRQEYSKSITSDEYSLFMRRPNTEPDAYSILRTFSPRLWKLFGVTFILLSICFTIIAKYLPNDQQDNSWGIYILATLCGLCCQSSEIHIRSISGRILFFLLLFIGYVTIASFSAVLISYISVEKFESPVKSLTDARVKQLSVCTRTMNVVYTELELFTRLLENGEIEVLPEWEKFLNKPNCIDINDYRNIPKIFCEPQVAIYELMSIVFRLASQRKLKCEFIRIREDSLTVVISIPYTNLWPYAELIDMLIIKSQNAGLLSRLYNKWIGNRRHLAAASEITTKYNNYYEHIGPKHIWFVIRGFVLAIHLSIFLFILELGYFTLKRKRQLRQRRKKFRCCQLRQQRKKRQLITKRSHLKRYRNL